LRWRTTTAGWTYAVSIVVMGTSENGPEEGVALWHCMVKAPGPRQGMMKVREGSRLLMYVHTILLTDDIFTLRLH
jgi:hypothetical protein